MPTLILMRGLPGSGKSTLAQQKKEAFKAYNPGEIATILSTDDFFARSGFDGKKLGLAHRWNQKRCETAMQHHNALIIIDNTNTTLKEMRSYAMLAAKNGYQLELLAPNNDWSWNPQVLATKTIHGVPLETIEKMAARFQHDLTAETVLADAHRQLEKHKPAAAAASAAAAGFTPGYAASQRGHAHQRGGSSSAHRNRRGRGKKSSPSGPSA
jgi:hypothetical protein